MKLSYVLAASAGVLVGMGICTVLFLLVQRPTDAIVNQDLRSQDDPKAPIVSNSVSETEGAQRDSPSEVRSAFRSVRSLADTLAFETDFDQTVALYTLLEHADEALVLGLIQQTESISPPSQRIAALSIIFSKYAHIDPYRALEHAKNLEEHVYFRMLPSIFHSWSRSSLEEALLAAETLEGNLPWSAGYIILTSRDDLEPNRRTEIAARFNLQRELGEFNRQAWLRDHLQDPRKAWQESLRSTDPKLHTRTTRGAIARAWITKEGLDVLSEIITTLPDEKEQRSLVSSLLPWLVRTDPEGTMHHVSNLVNIKDVSDLKYDLFDSWGQVDPESAFEALQSEVIQRKQRLSDRLLYEWARRDSRKLLEKANRMPSHVQDKARKQALVQMARSSPQEALARLSDFPELQERDDVAGEVARSWSEQAPHSALQWYLSLDMANDSAFRSRARQLTMRLTESDPDLAIQVATQTPGNLGSAMVSSVFNELAFTDARVALQYVPRLSDEHKHIAIRTIGSEIANADIREALRMSGQLDSALRQSFNESVIDRALRSSRTRDTLIEIFDTMPNQNMKNQAAKTLLYEDQRWGFLSKAERRKMYSFLDANQRADLDKHIASRRARVYTGPARTD